MWELREGLRKRGESWHKWPDEDSTTWQAYSNPHTATESMDGTLIITGLTPAQAIAATLGESMTDTEKAALERRIDELCAEVERLKEREQNLVTILRNDCDIEASWDGLRRFWSIELTEGGCLMRDRACKAEAENAKLRELCGRALVVIENNCSECAYFYECNIVNDCKCVAPQKIRDELLALGATA